MPNLFTLAASMGWCCRGEKMTTTGSIMLAFVLGILWGVACVVYGRLKGRGDG